MDEKEVNIRFMMPVALHNRVQKLQGLFTFKEGKKPGIQKMYIRLIERGIVEFEKQNR